MKSHPLGLLLLVASPSALLPAQASWHLRYPSTEPPPRQGARMAFDEARGEAILLFGITRSDSWRWNGTDWQQVQAALPPSRDNSGLVYDSARQRVVLFGGNGGALGPPGNDLWEWDGTIWTGLLATPRPSPRAGHAMAFDRRRGVAVVFSGGGASNTDVWEWNGTSWASHASIGPAARNNSVMAFDPVNDSVLLYGGEDLNTATLLADTWSWDGSAWLVRQPATPPYLRRPAAMVADLHRARVVLYGGHSSDIATWEWDGAEWHALFLASMGPRVAHVMAYDSVRRETIAHGGLELSLGAFPTDTWTYRTPAPADYLAYGAGCPGSAGTPTLANQPYRLPWLGATFVARAANLAPAVGAVIFATGLASTPPQDLTPYGMPGCAALLSPIVSDLRVATAGVADWNLAIPNCVALAGTHLFQQAFAIEPGSNAAGIVVSNAAELIAGIR